MLAPWILSFFPPHEIYVEPFGGGASVLMRKSRARVEVYNDLDASVVNVFRVMREAPGELRGMLELTPYSREEYEKAHEPTPCLIEQARRTIILSFMGHGADSITTNGKSGFRAKTVNPNRHAALDWINYYPEVKAFHERLAGVTIENKDAFEIIPSFDSERTLFYLDPPYVHATRGAKHNYNHELTNKEHERLCLLIASLKGMVVLSGYRNEIYDSLGWKRYEKEALADGARERMECVWLNPAAHNVQKQLELTSYIESHAEELSKNISNVKATCPPLHGPVSDETVRKRT